MNVERGSIKQLGNRVNWTRFTFTIYNSNDVFSLYYPFLLEVLLQVSCLYIIFTVFIKRFLFLMSLGNSLPKIRKFSQFFKVIHRQVYNTRLLGRFAPIFYFNCEHVLLVYIVKQNKNNSRIFTKNLGPIGLAVLTFI